MQSARFRPHLHQLYLETVLRYRFAIAGVTIVSALLGLAYVQLCSPVYQAEVRVLIQHLGLALDGESLKTYDREFLSTQAEIIRSPRTVAASLAAVPLRGPTEPDADPVAKLIDTLDVIPLANTDIVRVTFQDADAEYAMMRLKSVIDAYRDHIRASEQSTATETLEVLTRKEQSLREELRALQEKQSGERLSSPLVGTANDTVSVESSTLRDLATSLAAARTQRIGWESLLNSREGKSEGPPPATLLPLDDATGRKLMEARQSLVQAETLRNELQSVLGPRHPERIAAERRVVSLQNEVQAITAEFDAGLVLKLNAARAEEQKLATLYAKEQERIKALDTHLLRERHLEAEMVRVDELRKSVLTTLQSLQLAGSAIEKGRASVSVQVLDDFVVPTEPIWPRPVPVVALSMVLGLLLSVALIAWREQLPLPGVQAESAKQPVPPPAHPVSSPAAT